MTRDGTRRGVALITGVGRRRSIGTALARGLAEDGWDLALGYWTPYDDRVGLERDAGDPEAIARECRTSARRSRSCPPTSPTRPCPSG